MSRRIIERTLDFTTGTWLALNDNVYEQTDPPLMHFREEVLLLLTLVEPDGSGSYQAYTDLASNDVFRAAIDDDFLTGSAPFVRANDWYTSKTVTMTDADDKVNCNDHGFEDNREVWFNSTGSLPSNITAYTTYYIINSTTNDFQIASTKGGAALDFGSDSTAVTTAYYGKPAFNVPGDWASADPAAGMLSIRLDGNTLEFLSAMETEIGTSDTNTGEINAYFELQVYPAGHTFLSGVCRADFALRMLLDAVDWQLVDTSDYTATPASDTTVTMLTDLTADIEVGADVRFLIGGSYYYGTVDTLTAGLLTVSGMTFPSPGGTYTDISQFKYQVLPASVASNYLTAAQVNALVAGHVEESLFDANTILAADTDNSPAAVTVAEDTVVGRLTGGNIKALTMDELAGILYSSNVSISGAGSISAARGTVLVTADTSGAGFTASLPAASDALALGMRLIIVVTGSNQLELALDGTDTVNGAGTNPTVTTPYYGYMLLPVSGGWIAPMFASP